MLRCAELGLHWEDRKHMTMGMVYDLIIEKGNDSEEWPEIATQADIASFFG